MIARTLHDKKGLYLAYNKVIQEEARQKFPKNIICKTTHALAYEYYARYYAKKLQNKLTSYKIVQHLDIEDMSMREKKVDLYASATNIAACALRIVNRFCFSIDAEIGYQHFSKYHLELLINKYKKQIDLEYDSNLYDTPQTFLEHYVNYSTKIAKELWISMVDTEQDIGIIHDVYLKLYQLSKKKIKNIDFILIDESQDANPAVLDILNNQNIQRIYVGDQYQQIYRWRGSLNAMREIQGHKLYLTQSFRFGNAIAVEANKILAMLGETNTIKPNPKISSKLRKIAEEKHTIICRTNSGILKKCLAYQGKKIACVGGIKASLEDFKSGYYLWQGNLSKVKSPGILIYQTWGNLVEEATLTLEPSIKGVMNFIDEYSDKALEIIKAIESTIISDETSADIILTTAHKSKGQQWDRVKIAEDFKPIEYCGIDDLNLWYVSITRAIEVLDVTEIKNLTFSNFLSIELVPMTAWFSNVRSILKEHEWRKIKRRIFLNASYRCEICGGCGKKWPVECHEIWEYNDNTKKQTLLGLTALCPACHEVKHIGLATKNGRREIATKHLCKVNGWSREQGVNYIEEQFIKWKERSRYDWQLDISYLKNEFGINIQDHERKNIVIL